MSDLLSASAYDHTIRLNGVHGFVFSVREGGQEITVSGWNDEHWGYKPGQKVRLIQKDGTETRYEFISVKNETNPSDQYFAELKFSPRQTST